MWEVMAAASKADASALHSTRLPSKVSQKLRESSWIAAAISLGRSPGLSTTLTGKSVAWLNSGLSLGLSYEGYGRQAILSIESIYYPLRADPKPAQ